jgi:hypothetical protein
MIKTTEEIFNHPSIEHKEKHQWDDIITTEIEFRMNRLKHSPMKKIGIPYLITPNKDIIPIELLKEITNISSTSTFNKRYKGSYTITVYTTDPFPIIIGNIDEIQQNYYWKKYQ